MKELERSPQIHKNEISKKSTEAGFLPKVEVPKRAERREGVEFSPFQQRGARFYDDEPIEDFRVPVTDQIPALMKWMVLAIPFAVISAFYWTTLVTLALVAWEFMLSIGSGGVMLFVTTITMCLLVSILSKRNKKSPRMRDPYGSGGEGDEDF